MSWPIYSLVIWNLLVFLLYGLDKYKSIHHKWRIKESILLLTAFLMGGLGALVGMFVFRHKTKHLKFKILVPLAVLFNIALVILYYYLINKI